MDEVLAFRRDDAAHIPSARSVVICQGRPPTCHHGSAVLLKRAEALQGQCLSNNDDVVGPRHPRGASPELFSRGERVGRRRT
jgi:hypothetical protein